MSRGDFVRIIGLPGVINRIYPEEMFVAVQCRKGTGIVTVRAEQVLSEERFLIARWQEMGLMKRVQAETDAILNDSAALQVMIERPRTHHAKEERVMKWFLLMLLSWRFIAIGLLAAIIMWLAFATWLNHRLVEKPSLSLPALRHGDILRELKGSVPFVTGFEGLVYD